MLCRVYNVSRFGYQSWKTRGQSVWLQRDAELTDSIERVFGEVDGVYGSHKIHEALRQEAIIVGKNRVARLMREIGLKACCARIYRCHAKMDRFYASIRNEIHEREATGPDQIWVGDVTYLRVNDEWRYLAVVLNKFSRRVVGWSLSKRRNVDGRIQARRQETIGPVWTVFSFRSRRRVRGDPVPQLVERQWCDPEHEPQGRDE